MAGMIVPFLMFWVLLFVGRQELQIKGIAICIAIWAALLTGCILIGLSPLWFLAAMSFLDIGLILYIFGGDISIR